MQNSLATSSKNVIARALNSSEFRMMMDACCLPTFMAKCLGGDLCAATREAWDEKCKQYYYAMGSPPHLHWMDVLIPFGISFDNAPTHMAYRKEALRPRVSLHEEFRTLFEHAVTGMQFDIDATLLEIFDEKIGDYMAEAHVVAGTPATVAALQKAEDAQTIQLQYGAIDFYINCQFHRFPKEMTDAAKDVAYDVFGALMQAFEEKAEAYRQANGHHWTSKFRRDQAMIDHRWWVFLPEQLMPLGNTTPDLHQTAEMLVSIYKGAIRSWAIRCNPEAPELKRARFYDEVMQKHCEAQNVPDGQGVTKDMHSIRGSIARMWKCCQVVAKPRGERFLPSLLNPVTFQLQENVDDFEVGTGGAFPPKRLH